MYIIQLGTRLHTSQFLEKPATSLLLLYRLLKRQLDIIRNQREEHLSPLIDREEAAIEALHGARVYNNKQVNKCCE